MYEPSYNSVLVQIDDKDAEWGSGNDESMLGKSFSKGTVIRLGEFAEDDKWAEETLEEIWDQLKGITGKSVIWNEGAEAGTTFEFDGQLFGFIYWSDIRGIMVNDDAKKNKRRTRGK